MRVAGPAALLAVASLVGCMEFMDLAAAGPPTAGPPPADAVPETTSVTVRVAGPLTVASAKGSHADIASVTITVTETSSRTQVATAELKKSPAGVWTGTLSGLTIGTQLTFTATAVDGEGTTIFTGTHTATLNSAGAQITIRLSAVDDGAASTLPKITAISIANVSTGSAAEVSITVSGAATETLEFEFAGDAFTPKSGSVTLSSGSGTITSSYAAPSVPGWYAAQVVVRNAQGHRIQADFQIRVQTSGLSATLGPAVLGVTGRRTPAGIRWLAAVSAAGDGTGLTYAWKFTKTAGPTISFTDAAANPAMMTGYATDTAGTLSVTVTDADSLTSTASVKVPAGLFPDLPLAPAKAVLLVNEVDYDQDGSSDNAEFIEILNPGSGAVDLSLYRVELVDGRQEGGLQGLRAHRFARRRRVPGDRGQEGLRRQRRTSAGRNRAAAADGLRHSERPGRRAHRGGGGRSRRGRRPLRAGGAGASARDRRRRRIRPPRPRPRSAGARAASTATTTASTSAP